MLRCFDVISYFFCLICPALVRLANVNANANALWYSTQFLSFALASVFVYLHGYGCRCSWKHLLHQPIDFVRFILEVFHLSLISEAYSFITFICSFPTYITRSFSVCAFWDFSMTRQALQQQRDTVRWCAFHSIPRQIVITRTINRGFNRIFPQSTFCSWQSRIMVVHPYLPTICRTSTLISHSLL